MNAIEEHYLECAEAVVAGIQAILDGDINGANDIVKDKNLQIFSFAALDIATSIVQTLCMITGQQDPAVFWEQFSDISPVSDQVRKIMEGRTTNIKV